MSSLNKLGDCGGYINRVILNINGKNYIVDGISTQDICEAVKKSCWDAQQQKIWANGKDKIYHPFWENEMKEYNGVMLPKYINGREVLDYPNAGKN